MKKHLGFLLCLIVLLILMVPMMYGNSKMQTVQILPNADQGIVLDENSGPPCQQLQQNTSTMITCEQISWCNSVSSISQTAVTTNDPSNMLGLNEVIANAQDEKANNFTVNSAVVNNNSNIANINLNAYCTVMNGNIGAYSDNLRTLWSHTGNNRMQNARNPAGNFNSSNDFTGECSVNFNSI